MPVGSLQREGKDTPASRTSGASLRRGSVYLAISSLLFMLSGYVIHIWLGKHLGPGQYGTYNVVVQVMTALNMVHYIGVPQAVSRVIASDDSRADAVLRSGLVLQVGGTAGVAAGFLLLARPIALALNDPALTPYIQLSALVLVPYSAMTLYMTGYHNGLRDFRRQALIYIVYSIAKVVCVIGLAFAFHVYGAIAGFVVSPLIGLLVGFRRPRSSGGSFPYGPLVRFSLPLIVFSVLSTLLLSVDLFLVKALLGDPQGVGYYSADQTIARLPYYAFTTGVAYLLLPSVARSLSRDTAEETRALVRRLLRAILLTLVPGTLLLAGTSDEALRLLYGDAYLPGAGALALLTVGSGLTTLFALLTQMLTGAGRPQTSMLLSVGSLSLTGGACALLVPALGLTGAALGATIGGGTAAVAAGVLVHRRFGGLIAPLTAVRIPAAGAAVFLVARALDFPPFLLPLVGGMLFVLYTGLLTLMGELTPREWTRAREGMLLRFARAVPGRWRPAARS
jgi:stage V sporulation protein B